MKCPDCGHENLPGEETCEACHTDLSQLALPEAKANKEVRQKILEGTVSQLKPRAAVTLTPDRPVAEAVRLMRERKMGCVVVTQDGQLKGVFTERDLLNKVAGLKDPARTAVAEVMNTELHPLSASDTIAFAFHDMAVKGYRHIPVHMKDGSLGVISSRDLLRYLCQ